MTVPMTRDLPMRRERYTSTARAIAPALCRDVEHQPDSVDFLAVDGRDYVGFGAEDQ